MLFEAEQLCICITDAFYDRKGNRALNEKHPVKNAIYVVSGGFTDSDGITFLYLEEN
jgi:hypothetical protein